MATKYRPKITRPIAMKIAQVCANGSLPEIVETIRATIRKQRLPKRSYWHRDLSRLADIAQGLIDGTAPRLFSIFALDGNRKLPFASFSTLPIVTCPGMGKCREYCYSLKGWQYTAAFCRQAQNTILMRFGKRSIIRAFERLKPNIDLRLYVDGDFDSPETALFWWVLLAQRPDIRAYGYSKSLEIIDRTARLVPANYTLNLSNGSRYDDQPELVAKILSYPFTRGRFVAVKVDQRFEDMGSARYNDPEYHRAVRDAAQREGLGKVFSCGGQCGDCTSKGHACGARRPDGSHLVPLTIAIGVH
jgi:hypothetical protein